MALSRYEINKHSEQKRGIVTRGYKLPETTVELIKNTAKAQGISQAALIEAAVRAYAEKQRID